MILAVDIGNTNVRWALFSGEQIASRGVVPTPELTHSDQSLERALAEAGVAPSRVRRVIVGSVVSEAAHLREDLVRIFGPQVVWAHHRMDFGFDIEYDDASCVGIDRLAGALAAVELFGVPVIVADLGSAITVDTVTADRRFLGGAIAPGRRMGAQALHRATSLLPLVDPGKTPDLTGRSTAECIRTGLFHSALGLVDGLVEKLRAEVVPGAYVVATGGDAPAISSASRQVQTVNPDLVLRGLYFLSKRAETGEL